MAEIDMQLGLMDLLTFINTVTPNEKDNINNFNKGPIEGYKFIGKKI